MNYLITQLPELHYWRPGGVEAILRINQKSVGTVAPPYSGQKLGQCSRQDRHSSEPRATGLDKPSRASS
jgi:hypothetical protein